MSFFNVEVAKRTESERVLSRYRSYVQLLMLLPKNHQSVMQMSVEFPQVINPWVLVEALVHAKATVFRCVTNRSAWNSEEARSEVATLKGRVSSQNKSKALSLMIASLQIIDDRSSSPSEFIYLNPSIAAIVNRVSS